MKLLSLITLIVTLPLSNSYGVAETRKNDLRAPLMSRTSFMTAVVAGAATVTTGFGVPPASAKDAVDPKLQGTKQDPEFEACLSKCLYECTKPKGVEQRSRKECLPECKSSCAKTKEQLMLGKPMS